MKIVAHRGLLNGPDKELENRPSTIYNALENGFDVEIDMWWNENEQKYYLGHDEPQYKCPFEFLFGDHVDKIWYHCKDLLAFRTMISELSVAGHPQRNIFYHTEEDVVLTSKGHMWSFPGKAYAGSYAVLPEITQDVPLPQDIAGICTDYALYYRSIYE